jgi:hypothetical protein
MILKNHMLLLLRIGHGQRARASFRTAADLSREMGLTAWLARAESHLRAMGEEI